MKCFLMDCWMLKKRSLGNILLTFWILLVENCQYMTFCSAKSKKQKNDNFFSEMHASRPQIGPRLTNIKFVILPPKAESI